MVLPKPKNAMPSLKRLFGMISQALVFVAVLAPEKAKPLTMRRVMTRPKTGATKNSKEMTTSPIKPHFNKPLRLLLSKNQPAMGRIMMEDKAKPPTAKPTVISVPPRSFI
jgi:hypothetical protein